MRPHDGEGGDVAVGDAVAGLLFHFGEDVAYDLGWGIGGGRGGDIDSYIAQLGPTHRMIKVVFTKVVLREVGDVGELNMWDVRWSKHTDVHCEM